MKKIFPCTVVALLLLTSPIFCLAADSDIRYRPRTEAERHEQVQINAGLMLYPTEQALLMFEHSDHAFRSRRGKLALDLALEDIAANIPTILLLRKDFGVSFLNWVIPIAEKLPSQPVAVVQLLVSIDNEQEFDAICPRAVIEDSVPYPQYKNWMERSILALESFTMTDAAAEEVRRDCLGKIKHALVTWQPW